MVEYTKPWMFLEHRWSSGVGVGERDCAAKLLKAIGYYLFTGYLYPFRKSELYLSGDKSTCARVLSGYRPGATLHRGQSIIDFDRQPRMLAADGLERIEVKQRSGSLRERSPRTTTSQGDPAPGAAPGGSLKPSFSPARRSTVAMLHSGGHGGSATTAGAVSTFPDWREPAIPPTRRSSRCWKRGAASTSFPERNLPTGTFRGWPSRGSASCRRDVEPGDPFRGDLRAVHHHRLCADPAMGSGVT
ncbi:Abi family protein [Rhodococcus sp. B50]|uniref:Abi family protein n=1 Tax=Rhodococcus sp. B50 TaxID=2682847 RepID=UPI0035ABCB32